MCVADVKAWLEKDIDCQLHSTVIRAPQFVTATSTTLIPALHSSGNPPCSGRPHCAALAFRVTSPLVTAAALSAAEGVARG
jgi:hypothetical protein